METKSLTNLQAVSGVFENHADQWISSKGAHDLVPELERQEVYASVSELTKRGILERRKMQTGTGFEYKITPLESRSSEKTQVRRIQRTRLHGTVNTPLQPDQAVHDLAPNNVTVVPEGVRGRSQRVVWTLKERYDIAEKVVQLQMEQPHLPLMQAVALAQQILPEKRRRLVQIQSRHHIPWIDDMLAQVKTDIKNKPVLNSSAGLPLQSEPAVAFANSTPVVEQSEPNPLNATAGQILDSLIGRFGATLKNSIFEVLRSDELKALLSSFVRVDAVRPDAVPLSSLQQPQPHVGRTASTPPVNATQRYVEPPKVAEAPTEKLKRVLVMGLIPSQIQEVANEFKGALDLRFWRTDQAPNLLKSLIRQVDQTVVMTDFIAHSHEALVKNADVPFIRQPGGISRLKEMLTNLYADD